MNSNPNQRALFPSSQDEGSSTQPRQPSNMQDLLRYAIEAGQNEEGQENVENPSATVSTVDQERYDFLQNALKHRVNPMEEINKYLRILQTIDETGPEGDISVFEDALDVIADYCGNVDVAKDFCNGQGLSVIFPLLSYCRASIRWRAATVYGECCQNNPYCQVKVLEEDELLGKLLNMTDCDSDSSVKVKSLFAVSSIVRGNQEGLQKFTSLDGFSVIMRAMQTEDERLITKTSFFLRSVCSSNPEVKDELLSMGFVEQLVGLIVSMKFSTRTEQLLLALEALIHYHSAATGECRRLEFGFQSYLENLIDCHKNEDSFLEIVACARELLSMIQFPESTEKDDYPVM